MSFDFIWQRLHSVSVLCRAAMTGTYGCKFVYLRSSLESLVFPCFLPKQSQLLSTLWKAEVQMVAFLLGIV